MNPVRDNLKFKKDVYQTIKKSSKDEVWSRYHGCLRQPVSNGMKHRPERMGKLIREELSKIIVKEMEFENCLATIMEVKVDDELETARVMVSVLPEEKAKEVLDALSKKRNFLQNILFKKLNLKPMPRIWFEIDRGPENAAKVEKLLSLE